MVVVVLLLVLMMLLLQYLKQTIMSMIILVIQILPLPANALHANVKTADFASPSEYSACKCQDCRAKHDVVINAINALTSSVKELTSKRGLIPSKRILFPSAPLEIRAKRRRRVISRALSGIQKSEIATPLSVCCTKQRTMSKGEQHELKKVDIEEATAEQN